MSQPLFPSVWARYAAPAITPVVPFTYSDNVTYLHLLEELRKKIQELIESYNNFQGTIEEWAAELEKQLQVELDAMYWRLYPDLQRDLREYIESLVEQYGDENVARDATAGDRIVSSTTAIWRAYDNVRYWGLFARDYDELDRTAAEIDALEETARHYDLYATNGVLNIELGDYERNNA